MKKAEFLESLKAQISEYPYEETRKSLEYYEEMIDDRIEDGMSEDEAVASLGKVEDIAEQIKCELPITTLVRQKAKEKTNGEKIPTWVIVLLVLGSPLWIGLVIALGSSLISIYTAIWSVALAFWVVDVALVVCAVAFFIAVFVMLIKGSFASAIIYLGASLLSAGLTAILFMANFMVSKGIIAGTIWIFKEIKKAIIGKK